MTEDDHASEVIGAVQDAQLLVEYAAGRGSIVDTASVTILMQARLRSSGEPWDAAGLAAFWDAYGKIAKTVSPVSVASLKAMAPVTTKAVWWRVHERLNAAQRVVMRYRAWAFLALSALIVVQAYWLIGSEITKTAASGPAQIADLRRKQNELKTETSTTSAVPAMSFPLQMIGAQIDTLEQRQAALDEQLLRWNRGWEMLVTPWHPIGKTADWLVGRHALQTAPAEPAGTPSPQHKFLARTSAELALQVISQYVLPLLYGWLGASAYILRRLGTEVANVTYSPTSEVTYRLRMPLGALAGMAIGWFLSPELATGDAKPLASLSPAALAFLAGYSVEVLFAALDRFIGAFSSGSEASATTVAQR